METSACPVCTLYLREGMSLYDHLDTHPKEHVIEALVRFHEDSKPVANVSTPQIMHSTPYYPPQAQLLPMQQYSGNTYSYQPMISNTMSSSVPPVTMLLPQTNSSTSMPMMYNPFMMQQSQTPQVQVGNPSGSGLVQQTQTSIQRTICATSSLNVDARHFINSANSLPVQVTQSMEPTEKIPSQNFSNSVAKSVITTLPYTSLNKPFNCSRMQTAVSYDHLSEPFSAASSSQSMAKLPILRLQSTHANAGIPDFKRNNVRIVHILPKPQNSNSVTTSISSSRIPCVSGNESCDLVHVSRISSAEATKKNNLAYCDPENLNTLNASLPNSNVVYMSLPLRPTSPEPEVRSYSTPTILPATESKTPNSVTDSLDLSIQSLSPSFQHRPRSTPAISLSVKRQRTQTVTKDTTVFAPVPPASCQTKLEKVEHSSIQISFNDPEPKEVADNLNEPAYTSPQSLSSEAVILPSMMSTSFTASKRFSCSASSSKKRCLSNTIEHPSKRMARSQSDCLDIEFSTIDLTDLGDREYFAGQPSSSQFQTSSQEMLLNYSEDSEDETSTTSGYRKTMSPCLQADLVGGEDSKDHIVILRSDEHTQTDTIVKLCPTPSPTLSRCSASPGLRIRNDLGSKLPKDLPEQRILHKSEEFLTGFLNCNNEETELVDLGGESSLRIQLPPVGPLNSDEYITSDCFDHTDNKDVDSQETPLEQTKTQDNYESSIPLKGSPFDPKSAMNIVEIDGVHIMVPRQFYIIPDNQEEPAVQESSARPDEVSVSQDASLLERKKVDQIDDTHVSTSYDLLARESWITSDGSDTEVNADCNAPPAWEDVIESRTNVDRRFSKGRTPRVYKCAACGETFNCPKERRVHRSSHHANKDKIIPSELEPLVAEVTVECTEVEPLHSKKLKKKCLTKKITRQSKILLVKDESAEFLGVFVQEDGVTHVDEEPNTCKSPQVGSDIKPDVKVEDKTRWKCITCLEMFSSRKLLVVHLRSSHRPSPIDGNYMCDVCQEIYPSEVHYNNHLKMHPLECKTCGKNFFRRQNLILHMKRHLGIKPHKCNLCAKSFVTKQKLNEHKNVHTGAAPIKCPLCPMSFRRYSNLIQHKNRLHFKLKRKIKDYVCHCGDIFHSRKKLQWHKEVHDGKPKYCTFCSERFIHSASLTRHIRRAHDHRYMPLVGREAENVECSICGHMFLKSSIVTHMRLHTGERPFSCAVCGKNFTTKWNLQMHRWTHTSRSNKPYKCTLCKSAFSRESEYTQHMDAHRNKRQYTCNVCGEQFVRKNNCQRHVREHEAAKTFTCKECGKQFHRGYYLKDHMRVHTGARPFVCHICNKSSSTKSNHNKHVKIHHAREPVNTES